MSLCNNNSIKGTNSILKSGKYREGIELSYCFSYVYYITGNQITNTTKYYLNTSIILYLNVLNHVLI